MTVCMLDMRTFAAGVLNEIALTIDMWFTAVAHHIKSNINANLQGKTLWLGEQRVPKGVQAVYQGAWVHPQTHVGRGWLPPRLDPIPPSPPCPDKHPKTKHYSAQLVLECREPFQHFAGSAALSA
jgi:hypothetical protein